VTRAEAEEKLGMEHELQHSRKLPMKEDVGMPCILWPSVKLLASGHFLIITSLWFSCFSVLSSILIDIFLTFWTLLLKIFTII